MRISLPYRCTRSRPCSGKNPRGTKHTCSRRFGYTRRHALPRRSGMCIHRTRRPPGGRSSVVLPGKRVGFVSCCVCATELSCGTSARMCRGRASTCTAYKVVALWWHLRCCCDSSRSCKAYSPSSPCHIRQSARTKRGLCPEPPVR